MIFDDLEKNVMTLFGTLSQNDDFKKLVWYTTPDALQLETPLIGLGDLMLKNLFPVPKIHPASEGEPKTYVCIHLNRISKAGSNNVYQYNADLIVDVVSHIESWILDEGKIRPYRLYNIIDEVICNTKIESIRGNLVPSTPMGEIDYSNNYFGYRMTYRFTDSSGKVR